MTKRIGYKDVAIDIHETSDGYPLWATITDGDARVEAGIAFVDMMHAQGWGLTDAATDYGFMQFLPSRSIAMSRVDELRQEIKKLQTELYRVGATARAASVATKDLNFELGWISVADEGYNDKDESDE